jgi:hypothetical protein
MESHYPHGFGGVFVKDEGFELCIVDSKYNNDNFWCALDFRFSLVCSCAKYIANRNGRWQSHWVWNEGQLSGKATIQVHYFEDGNVQMHASHDFSCDAPESVSDLQCPYG